jgi:nitrile hydratase
MSHDHGHDRDHSELDETELRVRALQSILAEKGHIDLAALDRIIDTYQTRVCRVSPRGGEGPADPAPRLAAARRQRRDRPAGLQRSPGRAHDRGGEHRRRAQHGGARFAAATLPVSPPPAWARARPTARAVRDPRGVLADFGLACHRSARCASGTHRQCATW